MEPTLVDTLPLLNDEFTAGSTTSSSRTFHQFPRLPIEIRMTIWAFCFPRSRLISICISQPGTPWRPPKDLPGATRITSAPYTVQNHLGNTISNFDYQLQVPPFWHWSQGLLYVSQESWRAFSHFYRLSLTMQHGSHCRLRLNPERDLIEVRRSSQVSHMAIVAFMHDCMANDPKAVGITKLAMGRNINDLTHLTCLDPSRMHPAARRSVSQLLSTSLTHFYSCHSPSRDGRNMLGSFSWPRGPVHLNRSMPIVPGNERTQRTSFRLLKHDPRPIEMDLISVAGGTDPRWQMFLWHTILAKFDVQRSMPAQTQYLLAIWEDAKAMNVSSRAGFVTRILSWNKTWEDWMPKINCPLWGETRSQDEYRQSLAEIHDAAGVWVFGENAFGKLPDISDDMSLNSSKWQPKKLTDLREYWPGLMLFDLD